VGIHQQFPVLQRQDPRRGLLARMSGLSRTLREIGRG
jgi:hypothetical protein